MIPIFDGSRENFPVWWLRFKAFAQTYQYNEALTESAESHLPFLEEEEDDERDEETASRKGNSDAVYTLTLALEKDTTQCISKGMTDEWPSGKAHLIVRAFLRRFLPRDATSELEFSQALVPLRLESGEEPSDLFSQIADLSKRYGIHNRPEQQVIAVIMNALPMEYRAVLASELRTRERLDHIPISVRV
jgi:transcription termination factor NusB